jgi:hypothetical protein
MPRWIPQVSRPFNPAYGRVWKVMTPDERRASLLFDALVAVGSLAVMLYGCTR